MSAVVQQTPKLRVSEVWALYGGELEYCLGGEDGEEQEAEYFDRHSECSDGQASVGEHHTPSAPCEYELVSRHAQGLACLSNQDYYSQLEALKRMHLQNIAELEVLYLNELTASKGKASQGTQVDDKDEMDSAQEENESLPAGRETSTISKQDLKLEQKSVSETDTPGSQGMEGEQKKREEEEKEERASGQSSADATNEAQSLKPPVQLEPSVVSKATRAASKDRSRAPSRRSSWTERSGRRASRPVTVPKPFQMMLREADKKRRNVKTRSEVVLENALLRRELEEMRECRRQFRATPAPPRSRSVGRSAAGRRGRTTSLDRVSESSAGGSSSASGRSRNTSPQPFSFIERERKKRERKLEEALRSGAGSREERWVFKARPLPRIYRACSEDYQLLGAVEMHSRDQEQQQQQQQHRGPPASRGLQKHAGRVLEREKGSMEVDVDTETSEEKPEGREDEAESVDGPERPILDNANWTLRRKPSLVGKGLQLEGETGRGVRRGREREWSYIQPIQRTCISLNLASSFSVSHERMLAGKSHYISV
ncbi:protein FAM161A-like [Alosa sapidissima]|uniref:protein FAM161A-like n=1 Tax=Alosa sapidissima TaxID=34773 RepID=UPI001C0938FA|nr:protein FAM161A-like [Alosa sapidissima]XP_041922477.1 protein FAM161A-like [Alosa sapidissima]XP_041922478.1 protein FAM161A-like [Alosa sapidissima]XP_041922479.1 protein FAM161A-like [Alosa sapidissima]